MAEERGREMKKNDEIWIDSVDASCSWETVAYFEALSMD